MQNSTDNRRSQTVSTGKQVAGHDPGGLLRLNRLRTQAATLAA
jgi:hypothetical protein